MTFKLAGLGEFGLEIGGRDMLIGAELLASATVIENVQAGVASVHLRFVDDKRSAGTFGAYADGAKLKVTLGDGKRDSRSWQFRRFSLKNATANTAGELITLTGIADAVPWFRKTIDRNIKGTSADVIRKVAQMANLALDQVDSTDDKMNWLPDNRSLLQFSRRVMDHSWVGEVGSMFLSMVSDDSGQWKLRYQDIMKKAQASAKTLSCFGAMESNGDVPILDYRINSKSGFLNSFINYGFKVIQENLEGGTDVFDKLDVSKLTSSLGILGDLQSAVEVARAHYMPPALGNTHSKFAKALHHNTRSRATFSTSINVMLDQLTNLKLMDDVKLNIATSDGKRDPAYSGTYKVTAISRHVSRGAYAEKLTCVSQGQNADVFGGAL